MKLVGIAKVRLRRIVVDCHVGSQRFIVWLGNASSKASTCADEDFSLPLQEASTCGDEDLSLPLQSSAAKLCDLCCLCLAILGMIARFCRVS